MTGRELPPAHFKPMMGGANTGSEKAREEKAGESDHCVLRSH